MSSRPVDAAAARRSRRLREVYTAFLFLLPMLTLFVIFRYVPMLGAVGMSFTDFKISGSWEPVGLDNYTRLLSDPNFLGSLRTTLLYALIFVPSIVVVSLATAMLLDTVVWRSGLFRGALFLPYVTSFVLAGILWGWLFRIDGVINVVLDLVGLGPVGWLQDENVVLVSLAVVAIWKGFAYSMLILLAGLKAIPSSYLEAARVDGANAWRRFWHITLPLLRPVLFFVLVIETIAAFQVFDTVYVMTGGGPVRASYVLVYALYDQGFVFLDFGYAATIGIALFLVILVISLIQRRLLDRSAA